MTFQQQLGCQINAFGLRKHPGCIGAHVRVLKRTVATETLETFQSYSQQDKGQCYWPPDSIPRIDLGKPEHHKGIRCKVLELVDALELRRVRWIRHQRSNDHQRNQREVDGEPEILKFHIFGCVI